MRQFLPDFTKEFQNKIRKFRRWEDAQLSLLGRLLLVEGMKEHGRIIDPNFIKLTKYGKPYFDGETIEFNISHSGELVTCVICDNFRIGIDVEIINAIDIADFKFQMTDYEWKRIVSAKDSKDAFYRYWTEKEAVLKAHGRGLSTPLDSFEVIDGKTSIGNKNFFLKEIKLGNQYICHVASSLLLKDADVVYIELSTSELFERKKELLLNPV